MRSATIANANATTKAANIHAIEVTGLPPILENPRLGLSGA
jgi:hypothetical protein